MSTQNTTVSPSRKIFLFTMTLLLWLATVILGTLALFGILNIATFLTVLITAQLPEVGAVETRGWVTITRNTSMVLGGVAWLVVTIGGMEYHFQHIGERKSLRVFIWVLAIELMIIIIGSGLPTA